MELRFWGTRGSCASPFPDRAEFGGNTSCVSLRSGNCWLIFDGGTGIVPLAADIRQAARTAPCRVRILLSHYHLDHISGLPMFLAALPKQVQVTLYAAPCEALPGAQALDELIGPPLWPVRLTQVCPQLCFADLSRETVNDLGDGILLRAAPSNHPDGTSLFRITWQGRDIVCGLDCELTDAFEPEYIRFAAGCGCLLFDGAYTDADYGRFAGFGHSPFSRAASAAEKTGAGCVYVLHYAYAYPDELLREAERTAAIQDSRVRFAREGQSAEL